MNEGAFVAEFSAAEASQETGWLDLEKALHVVFRREADRRLLRLARLHEDAAGPLGAPRPPCHLHEQLEAPLRRAKVR